MFMSKMMHHRHFCFRNFGGVHTADADASAVHIQHYLHCFGRLLAENNLKNLYDKIHCRIVVVMQKHAILARLSQLGSAFTSILEFWMLSGSHC